MNQEKSTRRKFLEVILGGGALATLGSVLYPIIRFIVPPAAAEADPSQLKLEFSRQDLIDEPKKARYFKYGKELGIIFLTGAGQLKAMAATCTHLDCTVQHRPDLGIIWCSCHNGKYDLDGKNISGPPPRPLATYKTKEVGDVIFVSREEA